MKNFILLFLGIFSIELSAAPRTWTASDGRTLDAELVARTADTVTLKRETDSKEFSLPIASLSKEDQAFIKKSGIPVAKPVDEAALKALANRIPVIVAQPPLAADWITLTELHKKYQRSFSHIRPETVLQNAVKIRVDIERDIQILQPSASTTVKDPPYLLPSGKWSKGGGAWAEVWSAQSALTWLRGPLSQHLEKIETLAR